MGHQPLIKSNHLYKEKKFQTTIFRAICWTADRHNSTKLACFSTTKYQLNSLSLTVHCTQCTFYHLYRVSSQHIELFGVNTNNVYLHSMCYDAMDWQCTVGWQCCSRVLLNQQCWYRSLRCVLCYNYWVQCNVSVWCSSMTMVQFIVQLVDTGAERCNSN